MWNRSNKDYSVCASRTSRCHAGVGKTAVLVRGSNSGNEAKELAMIDYRPRHRREGKRGSRWTCLSGVAACFGLTSAARPSNGPFLRRDTGLRQRWSRCLGGNLDSGRSPSVMLEQSSRRRRQQPSIGRRAGNRPMCLSCVFGSIRRSRDRCRRHRRSKPLL
jgi:hypothetical protein